MYSNPGFGFWVTPDDLPSGAPVKLSTNSLNYITPGLIAVYGTSQPISVKMELLHASNYRSWYDRNSIFASTDIRIYFNVTKEDGTFETAVDIHSYDVDTFFTTRVEGSNVVIVLEKIVLKDVTVITSTIGDIDTQWLTNLFNVLFLP